MLLKIFIFALSIEHFTLENGLNVYLVKNKIAPLVTVALAFRAGGEYQNPQDAGLFHLVEHMFFKGNKKYKTQEEYIEKTKELGIIDNGATSHNLVYYYYVFPSKNLEQVLDFVKNAMFYPLFDEKELEKERKVVLDEYNRDYSDPLRRFYTDISRLLYGELFYRVDLLGPKYNILKADREILLEQYDRFYGPANCNIVVSGDIEIERTKELIKKIFSKWKKDVVQINPQPFPPLENKKFLHVYSDKVKNCRIIVEFLGPGVINERRETYVGDLISRVFSLPYSPFQEEFVHSGLSSTAYLSYYTKRSTGVIYMMFETDKENIEKLKEKVFEFIENCDSSYYFSDKLIEDAKIALENEWLLNTENPVEFAQNLGFWICTADFEYFKNYIKDIKSIEKEEIANFMRKYIKNNNYVFGIIEPLKEGK